MASPAQDSQEIRSLAIAKLKRAASLPRRQPLGDQFGPGGQSPVVADAHHQIHDGQDEYEETLTPARPMADPLHLGGSPYTPHDLTVYAAHAPLSRSNSASGHGSQTTTPSPSSYRPVAPPGRSTPSPLPSLGELRQLHRANSAAGRSAAMNKLMGGPATPTPEPVAPMLHRAGSLSSSTMLATHSSPGSTRPREAPTFGINSPSRRRVPARTGTAGGVESSETMGVDLGGDDSADELAPARPRLERSYTVGNGGGEERRSVIGRRMMQRLGTRVADRLEALEVPQRDQATQAVRARDLVPTTGLEGSADQEASPPITPVDATRMHSVLQDDSPTDPHNSAAHHQDDTTPPRNTHLGHPPSAYLGAGAMSLAPGLPEGARAPSRTSAMSGDDAFEYEVHLRRSLSEKERRNKAPKGSASEREARSTDEDSFDGHDPMPSAMPTPVLGEPIAMTSRTSRPLTGATSQRFSVAPTSFDDGETELLPPMAAFASPSTSHLPGHTSALSGSSGGSITSLDPIARIPFIVPGVGDSPGQNARLRTARGVRERNDSGPRFPVEVDDSRGSSGYGTPKNTGAALASPITTNPDPSASSSSTASLVSPARQHESPVAPEPPVSASGSAFKEHFDDDTDEEAMEDASPASLSVPLRKGSAASWEIVEKEDSSSSKNKQDGVASKLKRSLSRSLSRNKKPKPERSPATASFASSARSSHARASQASSGSAEHSGQQHGDGRAPPPPSAYQDPSETSRKGSVSSGILSRTPSVKLEPGQSSPMPQVSPMDPRYNNVKLFPAPGIAPPPLLQQASDSAVPILETVRDGENSSVPPSASVSYYDLAGQVEPAPETGTSVGKKSWLAEAFFAPTGAKYHRKKPSNASNAALDELRYPINEAVVAQDQESAESSMQQVSAPAAHATSDGHARESRGTLRQAAPSAPVHPPLSKKSGAVLQRLDHILSLAPEDQDRPDVLDDPPRRLILCAPMLQVVNGHTVKDRFLFLFNDMLVIAKPLSDTPPKSALDGLFAVKSIVSLDALTLLPATSDEKPGFEAPQRHPVVLQFIDTFARDPAAAIKLLYERSQLQGDTATLASLLFKTPELDKEQLGQFLARRDNLHLLRAFIDRFKFQGVRLDEALRVFLLSIRLPPATVDVEAVLNTLAERWVAANEGVVTFRKGLAGELVMAIMQLNDAINPGSGFGGFAFPNPAISMDDFVGAFRTKDTKASVPTDLLEAIYAAVRRDSLAQSLPQAQAGGLREVIATRMPTRLTHNKWSEPTFISIPRPDPRFGVKLHGEGLVFDPPHLDFSNSTEESFRVMGTSFGTRSLLVTRVGANAPLYANLPNAKTFVVERPFMRFTFQVAFVNHLGVKRKYCFSVDSVNIRDAWVDALTRNITSIQAQRSGRIDSGSIMSPPVRSAAHAAALRVLQDAFIAEEKAPATEQPEGFSGFGLNGSKPFSPPPSLRKPKIVRQITGRRISVAKIMMPLQKGETDPAGDGHSGIPEVDEEPPIPEKAQTGKDIVLICRQNSILPLVLGLLHAGMDAVAARPQAAEFGLFGNEFRQEQVPAA